MKNRKGAIIFMEKFKKILAWTGIILLVGMYVLTLILAIVDSSATAAMFKTSFACSFLIPIMLYAYMLVYKWMKDKQDSDKQ